MTSPVMTTTLESRFFGQVICPGDADYDTARHIHSPGVDRRPAMIVRAADSIDVMHAIELARSLNLPIAVRSGGHSLAGHSTVDDGLVIDLSGMNAVRIDPESRTAWVQPGARTADLVSKAEPFGLGLSTGDTSTVGLGGLTLGGGIGWMVRKHGLTIDNLRSIELVTADGRLVTASKDENLDLFWALRGGGGNFGVVTGFEFQLHEVGMVIGGMYIFPATPQVIDGYASYAATAPDELTTIATLMHVPPLPFVPESVHGSLAFVVSVCYTGDQKDSVEALAPIRALAEPLGELIAPMPYSAMFRFTEMGAQPHDSVIRSGYLSELSGELVEMLLDYAGEYPSPFGMIQIRALGGAFARVPEGSTAFAHRDKPYFLAIIHLGKGEEIKHWVCGLWDQIRIFTEGTYVNFLDDEGTERVREAYGPENWSRLVAIKQQYDPENTFRMNQNIVPDEPDHDAVERFR
jgi:hypothetical protein